MVKSVLVKSVIVKNVMTSSKEHPSTQNEHLLVDIKRIVEQARGQVKQPVEQGIINNLQQFLLGLGKATLRIVETHNYRERCNGK